MFRRMFAMLAVLGTSLFASAQDPLTHTKDTPEEVKKNLKENKAILIDVRSLSEREDGALKGSLAMPLPELGKLVEDAKFKEQAKGKIVYTHCAAGRRALKAGELLKSLGYDVRPLKLGYEDLLKEGLEKDEKK